jgi:hypothetical protein
MLAPASLLPMRHPAPATAPLMMLAASGVSARNATQRPEAIAFGRSITVRKQ